MASDEDDSDSVSEHSERDIIGEVVDDTEGAVDVLSDDVHCEEAFAHECNMECKNKAEQGERDEENVVEFFGGGVFFDTGNADGTGGIHDDYQ